MAQGPGTPLIYAGSIPPGGMMAEGVPPGSTCVLMPVIPLQQYPIDTRIAATLTALPAGREKQAI